MANDTPARPRMSLYANLLNESSNEGGDAATPGTTISSAPVVYKQPPGSSDSRPEDIIAAAKSKLSAAALRFQPTKRPTIASQKPKNLGPKPTPAHSAAAASATPPQEANAPQNAPPPPPSDTGDAARQVGKTTIEDWAVDEEEDAYYLEQKRQQQQRGSRKKRKKNKEQQRAQPVNWDDIYDPSRPNNYDEYKNSEESIREIRDWKDRLYAHRMAREDSSLSDSDDDGSRPPLRNQFAPPDMSFAPPTNLNDETPPPPPPPPADIPDAATGEDAYAQRMRMSQQMQDPPPPPPPDTAPEPQNRPDMPRPDISRAPVRYNLPSAPADMPASEAELEDALQREEEMPDVDETQDGELRSNRPGQKGFAERLMNKYGWSKGSGLGAQGTGITTALSVKVEKAKRKPDSEGGGFVGGTQGRGKIVGGTRNGGSGANSESGGKFGAMSEVVVLLGMLDGMDLHTELGDGNLMQEIGEECGEKYGRVERVFIDQSATSGSVPVFVKFTSPLSGLRAVNALEGRIFNGNTITARFFDKERFDQGDYSTS